jgi:rootletin
VWFQKLEDSVLHAGEDYTVRGTDGSPAKIPARVREIITKNLSGDEPSYSPSRMENVSDLQEENRMLSSELNRVEEMLSASRAERDELSIKYNALSERVSRQN